LNSYIADGADWAAVFKMPDGGPPESGAPAFRPTAGAAGRPPCWTPNASRTGCTAGAAAQRYGHPLQGIYRVHQAGGEDVSRGPRAARRDAAHLNNPLGGFGLNSGITTPSTWPKARPGVARRSDALLDRYVRPAPPATVSRCRRCRSANKRLLEERDPAGAAPST